MHPQWTPTPDGILKSHERLGHIDCSPGAPPNPFGLDFKAAGLFWTKELCEKDSDGDGLTNGQELGANGPRKPRHRFTSLSSVIPVVIGKTGQ